MPGGGGGSALVTETVECAVCGLEGTVRLLEHKVVHEDAKRVCKLPPRSDVKLVERYPRTLSRWDPAW